MNRPKAIKLLQTINEHSPIDVRPTTSYDLDRTGLVFTGLENYKQFKQSPFGNGSIGSLMDELYSLSPVDPRPMSFSMHATIALALSFTALVLGLYILYTTVESLPFVCSSMVELLAFVLSGLSEFTTAAFSPKNAFTVQFVSVFVTTSIVLILFLAVYLKLLIKANTPGPL